MIELKLKRKMYTDKQVLGSMDVYKNHVYSGTFTTLEKPWLRNEKRKSCIPSGFYSVEHWDSEKHPSSFRVLDTEPRTYILIHKGNYHTHTAGCILLGMGNSDVNDDGYIDVIHSSEAMQRLNEILYNEQLIYLNIHD